MFTKLVRIGRDAELRVLPNGTQVLNFPAVYDVGYGDKKKAQWLDCAMFGRRAESLSQHFTKGKQIVIYADDLQIETHQKNDNTTASKLKCKLVEFDFAGGQSQSQQTGGFQQAPHPNQTGGFAPQQPQSGFKPQQPPPVQDFDDDIPF